MIRREETTTHYPSSSPSTLDFSIMDPQSLPHQGAYRVPHNEAADVAESEQFDVEPEPYRFNFGKHRGRLLEEVPRSYILWIIREDVARNRPDLQAALTPYIPIQPITVRALTAPLLMNLTREIDCEPSAFRGISQVSGGMVPASAIPITCHVLGR